MRLQQRKERRIEEEKRKAMRIALKSFYGRRRRRDKTKRDAGFCRARSRLLRFAARGGGRQRRRRRRRRRGRGRGRWVASGPRREVHSSSGRRLGDGAVCKWWDGRLMRFVSPTWKSDTYGPVSISPPGRHTRSGAPNRGSACVGRRTTNIVIAHGN
ncbi:hypothetical protein ALC60_12985 [Trachymyrmex zeteki]|uniref:Uncharacterized protein n=1 Tax=Mycetomoellerius zeteki TaxID=64791 RepID=A0A151WK05_9HYME|nr:hypothetical protein ALC60_12985 [Trachymyrmex zeteki]